MLFDKLEHIMTAATKAHYEVFKCGIKRTHCVILPSILIVFSDYFRG